MKNRGHYVTVAGAVNVDIGGYSDAPLIMADSNPGRVQVSLGGVGRNIAHNLARMGTQVRFLTALGNDSYAGWEEAACRRDGIDLRYALRSADSPTSTYLYISDDKGNMQLAVVDMAAAKQITPDYLEEKLAVLNGSAAVAADANLSEEALLYLAEHVTAPIFADPVSVTKAVRLKRILPYIHTLKPNLLEAECLTGMAITDEEGLKAAAKALLDAGVKRVIITLGADGVLAADAFGMQHVPAVRAEVRNATGAGDAYMAGLIHGYVSGWDLCESARFAAAAAAITAESEETISETLNEALVIERRNKK